MLSSDLINRKSSSQLIAGKTHNYTKRIEALTRMILVGGACCFQKALTLQVAIAPPLVYSATPILSLTSAAVMITCSDSQLGRSEKM